MDSEAVLSTATEVAETSEPVQCETELNSTSPKQSYDFSPEKAVLVYAWLILDCGFSMRGAVNKIKHRNTVKKQRVIQHSLKTAKMSLKENLVQTFYGRYYAFIVHARHYKLCLLMLAQTDLQQKSQQIHNTPTNEVEELHAEPNDNASSCSWQLLLSDVPKFTLPWRKFVRISHLLAGGFRCFGGGR